MMRGLWLVVGVCLAACNHYDGYKCTESDQCMRSGVHGVCENNGFCSFPDDSCDSGKKFEQGAGGACVPACGHAGEACCEGELDACTGNAFCQAGTCAACVTDIAIGRRFLCAAKYDGTVWCSGANDQGQLGIGATSEMPRAEVAQVRDGNGMPLTDVVKVGAGYDFACAVKGDGTVWCWGANGHGALGNGVTIVVPVPMQPPPPPILPTPWAVQVISTNDQKLTGAAEVDGGDDWACARMQTGAVQCWGYNSRGRLGDGTTDYARSKAAAVKNLAGVAEIQLGGDHSCARTTANNILCWGGGGGGKLFDGGTTDRNTPAMVANASSYAAGRDLTCIVGPDTTISCAGWNGHGRFGIGYGESYEDDDDHITPVQTLTALGGPAFSGVAQVASGGVTCARMLDKTLYCWGDGTYGGTGTGVGSTVPLPVIYANRKPLTGVEKLYVGFQHGCVMTTAGELLCWGRNLQGELANGTFLNQPHPEPFKLSCP